MFKQRAQAVLSKVTGRFYDLEISHAKGCYIYDVKGNAYLDLGAGLAVASTGHCHPKVVEAIKNQAEKLIHPCIAVGYYEPLIDCAEKLTAILAPEPYHAFFTQSGTEAVETALKLAKYVSKRKKVIAFTGGFHGRTMGALSVTSAKQKYREGYGELVPDVEFFPYPYCYRCPWGKERQSCGVDACTASLLASPLFNEDVAAIIIEPILGEGGYVPAPIEFLETVAEVCKKHGILMILDEIQTGMGRTGRWFSYQNSSIQADIIVIAKGFGSGVPIGACLAKKAIMDQWPSGSHGGTYGGNPICCAAASASIDVIQDRMPQIAPLSKKAADFLTHHLSTHPNIGQIRVDGLMIGIECVKDKETKEPYPDMMQAVMHACLEQHVIILSSGIHGNVLRLAPPLIIEEETLLEGLKQVCHCIHDYH